MCKPSSLEIHGRTGFSSSFIPMKGFTESVCSAACLHIDASTPNVIIQEVFEDFATPFAERIVDYPIEIKDGYVLIPDRPGLGLDLNEAEMAKYPYDESHFLDLYGEGGWEKRNLDEA